MARALRAASALAVAAAAAGAGVAASTNPLTPLQWIPLKWGTVKPEGWLARELRIQGDGMSGYFDSFWEPVYNTQWLGGSSTHEDWVEIFPYVINGYVGQAILLNDAAQLAKVQSWLSAIIGNQTADGWFGPSGQNDNGMVYWPRWPVMAALFQWYEYTGDAKWMTAALKWTHAAATRVAANNPGIGNDWTGVRMQDWLWVNEYMIDLAASGDPAIPASEIPFLFNFTQQLYQLGAKVIDWERDYYVDPSEGGQFPTQAVTNGYSLFNHGVNNGMATKSGATLYRLSGGDPLGSVSSRTRLALFDRYHGMPTGIFAADEHLAGRMPSHGTETCAVVEMMFSLEVMHEALGDALYADRAEMLAYNALPGSMTKDMWTRVYLQQPNEPISVVQQPHVWLSDGPDAILYSLEGNYACCTANFNQGWPKYIQHMLHATPDGGVGVSMLGPVSAVLPSGVAVNVSGGYPFDDDVTITLSGLPAAGVPLYVRIPSWATGATVSVNGGTPYSVALFVGTMYKVDGAVPPAGSGGVVTVLLSTNPAVRTESYYNDAASVYRGALLYSVQLEESFSTLHTYFTGPTGNASDYNVTQPANTSVPWNVALQLDPSNPGAAFSFARIGPVPDVPFTSLTARNTLTTTAVTLSSWGFAADGSANPPPQSPVDCSAPGTTCGAKVPITLVPYGTTHLRTTEIPWIATTN